jgi:hypothetical protein
MKKIKPEDVAYELRELSKNTSLTPEIINIISHGYARICELERERDEARRSCCEFAAMVDSADTVVMYVDSNRFHEIAMRYMKSRGWDCFKDNA